MATMRKTLKKGEFWEELLNMATHYVNTMGLDPHMLASADGKDGRVGVVIDNGVSFAAAKIKPFARPLSVAAELSCYSSSRKAFLQHGRYRGQY
jgi:hypothetical protein